MTLLVDVLSIKILSSPNLCLHSAFKPSEYRNTDYMTTNINTLGGGRGEELIIYKENINK